MTGAAGGTGRRALSAIEAPITTKLPFEIIARVRAGLPVQPAS
jgi:hypothetical protein